MRINHHLSRSRSLKWMTKWVYLSPVIGAQEREREREVSISILLSDPCYRVGVSQHCPSIITATRGLLTTAAAPVCLFASRQFQSLYVCGLLAGAKLHLDSRSPISDSTRAPPDWPCKRQLIISSWPQMASHQHTDHSTGRSFAFDVTTLSA